MGLLLSILITCVGVLEVIACYTHFRVGVAYNECKSNIRDIAKYYALELRKHELHFEPGPDEGGGEGSSQETLSELVRKRIRSTIRVQEKSRNGQIAHTASNGHALGASCSTTPDQTATPNYSNLVVPRNSISGLDSPTVQTLISHNVNITEAVTEKIHRLESTESWGRKSPSPLPEKSGLEVVEKDFWRSRSPSPFPEINGESLELKYTPGLRQHRDASQLLDSLTAINGNLQRSPSGSELVDKDYWNNASIPEDVYTKTDLEVQDILPSETARSYSITDLEVQNLTRGLDQIPRQPSPTPNPEILFGMTNDEESKFDEEFLRSLDGVKISKCDDRRRSFRKKRNSSSTSSRAFCEDLRSITSMEDIESSERKEDLIPPLAEEDIETIVSEKCESLKSPSPAQSKDEVKVTQQEQTHFKASESTSTSDINKPTNLSFTEKVKDLEINVQLLVTVKGTSQGDQMQYTTSVAQQPTKPLEPIQRLDDNTVTKSTEEKSEFGKVKTSVTYGQANVPNAQNLITGENIKPIDKINDLKDLQISSQSLIHAERAVQDNVKSSEDEFMKLYESFTELPPREKDKFLKIIEQSSKDHADETVTHNLENPPEEIEEISNKAKKEIVNSEISNTDDSKNVKQDTNKEKEKSEVDKIVTGPNKENEISAIDKNVTDPNKEKVKSTIDKNVTDPNNKEIILLKEITEITESTETVMKLPPVAKPLSNISPDQSTEHESKINISLNEQNLIRSDTTESKICDTDKSKSTKIIQESEISKHIIDSVDYKLETNTSQEKQISNEIVSDEIRTTTIPSPKLEENKIQTETQLKEESALTVTKDQKAETPKVDSSSSSSETPTTIVENVLRRASKTAFEDATEIQNQEMIKRRVSNSEISPKQATQAFWLIFSAEYTNAMDKDWHGQHFSCWQCDESLTGQRYVLREEHPYCVKCYEGVFANTCEKCNRIIGIDSKDLSYKDKHWHEACFQCTSCNESLVDKQFGAKGEKIYCGKCYDKQFASKCDGCGKIFHAGTKKMEYKNRQWHEQCFKCCKCDTPIGTKSFIPREKEIYCAGCYEEKYATRCFKCEKAIQSGGVTYKNQPWHRECFTCTHCNKNLAGQRFTSRDDKPCCAECFGRLFAKRCTSCAEPITGIGGTRFISFEDRHWHNDCFICATCTTSLVGRGFITDEDKIICPECAKERFM